MFAITVLPRKHKLSNHKLNQHISTKECKTCEIPFSNVAEFYEHDENVHDIKRRYCCERCSNNVPKTLKSLESLLHWLLIVICGSLWKFFLMFDWLYSQIGLTHNKNLEVVEKLKRDVDEANNVKTAR